MVKWLVVVLASALPVFAGTLSGRVHEVNDKPVPDAKIVVFHDLGTIFLHRGVSDRKGQYLITLNPGVYRVIVLKKGFEAQSSQVIIVNKDHKLALTHNLTPRKGVESTATLGERLRDQNKRQPHQSLSEPLLEIALLPEPDESLIGTFRTRSLQDLRGEAGQQASVEVETLVGDQVRLQSKFINEHRADISGETQQIETGLAFQVRSVALNLHAGAIQMLDDESSGGSKALRVTGDWERVARSSVSLGYRTSEGPAERQQELSFSQDSEYQWANLPIRHEILLTGWTRDDAWTADLAAVNTEWRLGENSPISVKSGVEQARYEEERLTSAKVWLTGKHEDHDRRFAVETGVGYYDQQGEGELIQRHSVSGHFGKVNLLAGYRHDSSFQPYTTHDIFGVYLPNPLTPHATESFFQSSVSETSIGLELFPNASWNSSFYWESVRDEAMLLHAYNPSAFKYQARIEAEEYAYSLSSTRWGSRFEIRHGRDETPDHSFDRFGFQYVQNLSPFYRGGLGVLFEFQMTNHPNIPAWWILDEIPWDPNMDHTWFQGNLSLQF